jgi:flagellar hook assembly protein FlgD
MQHGILQHTQFSRCLFVFAAESGTVSLQATRELLNLQRRRPNLRLELDIFDVMGRPVRQIRTNIGSSGTRNIQVQWDGTGANGAKLPKGIYIYHLKLNAGNNVLQTSGRLIRN